MEAVLSLILQVLSLNIVQARWSFSLHASVRNIRQVYKHLQYEMPKQYSDILYPKSQQPPNTQQPRQPIPLTSLVHPSQLSAVLLTSGTQFLVFDTVCFTQKFLGAVLHTWAWSWWSPFTSMLIPYEGDKSQVRQHGLHFSSSSRNSSSVICLDFLWVIYNQGGIFAVLP